MGWLAVEVAAFVHRLFILFCLPWPLHPASATSCCTMSWQPPTGRTHPCTTRPCKWLRHLQMTATGAGPAVASRAAAKVKLATATCLFSCICQHLPRHFAPNSPYPPVRAVHHRASAPQLVSRSAATFHVALDRPAIGRTCSRSLALVERRPSPGAEVAATLTAAWYPSIAA